MLHTITATIDVAMTSHYQLLLLLAAELQLILLSTAQLQAAVTNLLWRMRNPCELTACHTTFILHWFMPESIVKEILCVGAIQPVSSGVCYRDSSSREEDFGICIVRLEDYADHGHFVFTTDTERRKLADCWNVYINWTVVYLHCPYGMVSRAGSMKWRGVCLSVRFACCSSMWRVVAVGLAGRRHRLTAAAVACGNGHCT